MTRHLLASYRARWASTTLVMVLLLPIACSERAPLDTRAVPSPVAPAPADEASAENNETSRSGVDADQLIAAANGALAKDRMFSPPGDNALELLLQIVAEDPEHRRARAGLADILPFVMIGLEQRLATGDLPEVERLLGLFRAADPGHPAIGRLQNQLDAASEQRRQDEFRRLAAEAESERFRALALSAPAQPIAAPVVSIEQASGIVAAPPALHEEVPPPSAPPAIIPAAMQPAPVSAPATLPPILAQVAPRYPTQAQRRRLEGLVEVEFTVAGNGSVSDVRVLRSEPPGVFDREAIGAMQRWRFQGTGQVVVGRRVFDFKLGES
jgi:protein TonB